MKKIPIAAFILDFILAAAFVGLDFSPWLIIFFALSFVGPIITIVINVLSVRKCIKYNGGNPATVLLSLYFAIIVGAILGALMNMAHNGGQLCSAGDTLSCMNNGGLDILKACGYCLLFAQAYMVPVYITLVVVR